MIILKQVCNNPPIKCNYQTMLSPKLQIQLQILKHLLHLEPVKSSSSPSSNTKTTIVRTALASINCQQKRYHRSSLSQRSLPEGVVCPILEKRHSETLQAIVSVWQTALSVAPGKLSSNPISISSSIHPINVDATGCPRFPFYGSRIWAVFALLLLLLHSFRWLLFVNF